MSAPDDHRRPVPSEIRLRRRKRRPEKLGLTFPAWRLWEDRRIRDEEIASALTYAVDIAAVSVHERSSERGDPNSLMPALYGTKEVPYRGGFRVTAVEALSRWHEGREELALQAIVVGVAALNQLLADVIDLLRAVGCDESDPDETDQRPSMKLHHLESVGVTASTDAKDLFDLCRAIRNSVAHHATSQRPVRRAQARLSADAVRWWDGHAARPFPLTDDADRLVIDERERIAAYRVFDRVALELNQAIEQRVPDSQWAELIAQETWLVYPAQAGDPRRAVRAVQRWAKRGWRYELDGDLAHAALKRRDIRARYDAKRVFIAPLPTAN